MSADGKMPEYSTDVLVMGGGGSGLAAAITARELGREAILLEKNPDIGGSTVWSIGSFSATCTPHQLRLGIKDNPEDHFEDIGKFNAKVVNGVWKGYDNTDNLELRRLLAYHSGETFRWVQDMGVRFFGPTLELPHRKPRMHNVLPNSKAYGYWCGKRARDVGVDIRCQRRVTRILMEGKRAVGLECTLPDGSQERYLARGGIVMACGDYAGGEEMKRRYAQPELVTMKTSCNPANEGDGHLMAMQQFGAKVLNSHMVAARVRFVAPRVKKLMHRLPPWKALTVFMELALHYAPDWLLRPFVMSFLTTVLEAQPSLFSHGAILVNKRGQRFCNELDHPELKLVDQPDHEAYIVFDERLAKKYSAFPNFVSTAPGVAYAYIPDYQRSRKDIFHKADSVEALASRIGVDAAVFAGTLKQRNEELAAAGAKDCFSVEQGPFYAMGPVSCFVKGTDAGLAVNGKLEILDGEGHPVQGLYGAGLLAQGGMLLEGHGHHIGWAFTSGRLAGRAAAYLANTADADAKKER